MTVALVARFVALSGSSYAAITLTKNSVKSEHIASGEVKRSDIGASAVNSARVADFSLLAKDFKPGQLLSGPKGDPGAPGARGPAGEKGPAGPAGGTTTVARPRGNTPLTPATAGAFEEFPLTGNTCSVQGLGEQLFATVKVNGTIRQEFISSATSPLWSVVPLDIGPGVPTARTLTVQVMHGCDVSGSYTINSVAVDVVGYR